MRRICITLFGPTSTLTISYPYSTVCVGRCRAKLTACEWRWAAETAVGNQQIFISSYYVSTENKEATSAWVCDVMHHHSLRPQHTRHRYRLHTLYSQKKSDSLAKCCSPSTFHSCHVNLSSHNAESARVVSVSWAHVPSDEQLHRLTYPSIFHYSEAAIKNNRPTAYKIKTQ